MGQLVTGGPLSRRRLGQMASTRLLSALGVTQVAYTVGRAHRSLDALNRTRPHADGFCDLVNAKTLLQRLCDCALSARRYPRAADWLERTPQSRI